MCGGAAIICQQPAALPALLGAMSHASASVVVAAAGAIACLCGCETGITAVLQHAAVAVAALSKTLAPANPLAALQAANAVAKLTASEPGAAAVVKDATAVQALAACLADGCAVGSGAIANETTTELAAIALYHLAKFAAGGPEVVEQANGCASLVAGLKHSSTRVRLNSATALQAMATQGSRTTRQAVAAAAAAALVTCLADSDTQVAEVAAQAIAAIANCARGQHAVVDAHGAQALAACLGPDKAERVMAQATLALRRLSRQGSCAAALLRQPETVRNLVVCMRGDVPMAMNAKVVLERLVKHDSGAAAPVLLSAVFDMAQAFQQLGSMSAAAQNLQEAIIGAAGQLGAYRP